jgi:hypothetical protein
MVATLQPSATDGDRRLGGCAEERGGGTVVDCLPQQFVTTILRSIIGPRRRTYGHRSTDRREVVWSEANYTTAAASRGSSLRGVLRETTRGPTRVCRCKPSSCSRAADATATAGTIGPAPTSPAASLTLPARAPRRMAAAGGGGAEKRRFEQRPDTALSL